MIVNIDINCQMLNIIYSEYIFNKTMTNKKAPECGHPEASISQTVSLLQYWQFA
jgi:hypothetical protein